ncbi:tRNA synthetases class I-domain-containing protein [Chytriomyces cf. hyalinus JEL632]|nr:tRNA synthetases class I-domain-containing protein [Chytriomyces cf. hyalinus JEL632]
MTNNTSKDFAWTGWRWASTGPTKVGNTSTGKIPDVPANISFPTEEHRILAFWKDIDAFQTSLKHSKGRKEFTFYDGPPFATGLPHYGHLLAGTIKDTVTRYAHQTGHHVERRFGWDCHGLPVEHEIDKKLNIKSPEDVMKIGIKQYNAECRAIVMKFSSEWETTVTRIGRWIDFKNDYKTLNTSFMESVWWVFKQLFDKGQIYRGFSIMPYSTACTTPMSNFEANQNYKDVIDPSVVVSFPLTSDPSVSLLAWTSTPWTLPSNLAVCVNPNFEYVKIQDGETGSIWILLQSRLEMLYKDPKKAKYTVLDKMQGSALKGLEYEPLYDYFIERKGKGSFIVMADTYVTDDSGTGIVHCAPAFGEDDYRVCIDHKVVTGEDVPCPIDASGIFTSVVRDYAGQYVKDADKPIQKDLKARNRLIRQTQFSHSYPFCWRSDTPLIYKAVPSWFVRVTNIKEQLMKNNAETVWVPNFVKEKRFANWLENARDWNISRNRYWGTPIPLWISDDKEEIIAIGSVAELEQLTGLTGIKDLHRESIDHLTIPSRQGKGVLRRTTEVLDCWFESGSMPFAQMHYPFENKDRFENVFPADFIAEGLDQTRGWFYTLLVLSTHLMDRAPWKNLIVNGLVLAADGKKMSKSKKNYPDPNLILEQYGADVLRLYLINSPVVRAEPLRFDEKGVKSLIAAVFLPWYNSYRFFFAQLALLKKEHNYDFKYDPNGDTKFDNVMDQWILASTQSLIKFVREEMAAYRLYTVVPQLLALIDTLTNWYIRFNRKRLKGDYGVEEADKALQTLFEVLFTLSKMMAPFTPFLTETMYQNLKTCIPESANIAEDNRSVHFLMFPDVKTQYFNADIERAVSRMQSVIELGRYIREKRGLALKAPLRELIVINKDPVFQSDIHSLESYIKEELNLKTVTTTADEAAYGVRYELKPDFKVLGQKLGKDLSRVKKALTTLSPAQVAAYVTDHVLVVEGITLGEGDLEVVRLFGASQGGKDASVKSKYEAKSSGDVLVILDVEEDLELVQEGLARELVNRVQRLRKKAGLQPVDDVKYFYTMKVDPAQKLSLAMKAQAEYLSKTLKQSLEEYKGANGKEVIIDEEQEVDEAKFQLFLVRA